MHPAQATERCLLPPEGGGERIDRRLAQAFAHPDPAKGLDRARSIARELEPDHPDAAASLREGLEGMFTVRRLGITGRLARSLTNTNCIESMISVARTVTRNVKRWRDGSMKKRWVAVGILEAERLMHVQDGVSEETGAAAIERLYLEEGDRLWRAALFWCGDREVASDAVAEAFAQTLHRGEAIRDPRAWVWKTAFRVAAGDRTSTERVDTSYELSDAPELIATALARLSPRSARASCSTTTPATP